MVILGTTGRTGLSAVFIGNTAEHVIDKINCDVLALKPKGYISPRSKYRNVEQIINIKTPLFWGVLFSVSAVQNRGIVASYLLDIRYIDE